ncbi:MAG: BadF/BadG/BcrA/BcrD ATPase family protein [Eggerthellaceae bacterium]|nr:BadF/BadG/BcrA/BcrD ATPase family protein [Eggerthellaceae bacterium]
MGEKQYFLAVDGGGTSTEFLLVESVSRGEGRSSEGEEQGEGVRDCVLCSFSVGSTSVKSVGVSAARENLLEGAKRVGEALRARGASPDEVFGVWGLSGCDSADDQARYERMVADSGFDSSRQLVCNDALLALRAVTAGPGVVLVAGTGSVALGVDAAGRVHRVGGWGYQVSDLGSGCWMGSRLIREALLYSDGCRAFDPVFDAVCTQAGCTYDQLGDVAQRLTRADELAAFARIVLDYAPESTPKGAGTPRGGAVEKSEVCRDIRRRAAEYLAGYITSVVNKAGEGETRETGDAVDVVLSGGLFSNESFYEEATSTVRQRLAISQRPVSPSSPSCPLPHSSSRRSSLPTTLPLSPSDSSSSSLSHSRSHSYSVRFHRLEKSPTVGGINMAKRIAEKHSSQRG